MLAVVVLLDQGPETHGPTLLPYPEPRSGFNKAPLSSLHGGLDEGLSSNGPACISCFRSSPVKHTVMALAAFHKQVTGHVL